MQDLSSTHLSRILSAILQRPNFVLENRRFIDPKVLFGDDVVYRQICRAALGYTDSYGEAPSQESIEFLLDLSTDPDDTESQSTRQFLSELYAEEPRELGFLGDLIVETHNKEVLRQMFIEGAELLDGGVPSEDIKEEVLEHLQKTQKQVVDYYDLHDLDAVTKWYERRKEEGLKLNTGYTRFDERIKGGVRRGHLILFIAGAKVGKTTTLTNFGANLVTQGWNVAHFSFEIGHDEVYERYIQNMYGATNEEIDQLSVESIRRRVKQEMEKRGKLRIVKLPFNGATALDMEGIIRSMPWVPDAIIVDYAMIVRATTSKGDRREIFAQKAIDLRAMADRLQMPVLSAWQGNRHSKEVMAKSGKMDDKYLLEGSIVAAECYDVVMHADVIATLNQDEEDEEDGIVRLWISESRAGASKGDCITYQTDFTTQVMVETGYASKDGYSYGNDNGVASADYVDVLAK